MHAIRIHHYGGPESLSWDAVPTPSPAPGQLLIRQTAVGVNFIDIYHRTGLYPLPTLPGIPGVEAAGVVEAIGEGVPDYKIGDRVAYVHRVPGAYTEYRAMDVNSVLPLPDGISEAHAAGILLKGLTARFLVRYSYAVNEKSTVLVHAAAGGVGMLVCQWAKHLGATVIGTVGSEAKEVQAKASGCDHVIRYNEVDVAARVMEITRGLGVNVAYDAVGQATFEASLDSLMELGLLVSYGQASGPIPPFDMGRLREKSLYITRPQLWTFTKNTAEYALTALDLFDMILQGKLSTPIHQSFYLRDAATAHRQLESRQTTGSTILITDEAALR